MQSDIGKLVGMRLREIRKHAGLTQPDLGDRAGMAAAEISKIENGRRTPTLETLERLGMALGVPVHEFMLFEGSKRQVAPEVEQILLRLQGQSEATIRRVTSVIDALVKSG